MIKIKSIFGLDPILFLSTIALMVIGVLFIYSSGISSTGVNYSNEYVKQIIWASLSVVLMAASTFFEYSRLKSLSRYLYLFMIFLLVITLFWGQVRNGAKSWLAIGGVGFQPSEFAKLITIIALGTYLDETKKEPDSLKRFLLSMVIMIIPFGLILLQPDLGTAMVFFPIFLVMLFLAETKIRYLLFVILALFLAVIAGMLPAWEELIVKEKVEALQFLIVNDYALIVILASALVLGVALAGYLVFKKRYFYWISYGVSIFFSGVLGGLIVRQVLKSYQIKRLIVFLDPSIDPQGAGWHVTQSVTAVGSGGLWGKGFLKGTQSHYRFLPQQSTDFIFSIIAEEWGFLGCLLVFALFLAILIRSVVILTKARDSFGLYIGGGCLGMVFIHFLVNIGMAMGVMPITGIPLFFLSYGGSALWTGVLAIGVLMNIRIYRYRY